MGNPKKLTKSQLAMVERARRFPVMETKAPDGGPPSYAYSDGKRAGLTVVRNCIARGLLIPTGDGLFGDSQTYRPA